MAITFDYAELVALLQLKVQYDNIVTLDHMINHGRDAEVAFPPPAGLGRSDRGKRSRGVRTRLTGCGR